MSKRIAAFLLCMTMAVCMCAPAAAFAATGDGDSSDSKVTLQYIRTLKGDEGLPTDDRVSVTVPATIPLAFRSDGSLVGPSADGWFITNNSIKELTLDRNAIWGLANDNAHGAKQYRMALNGAKVASANNPAVDLILSMTIDRQTVVTRDPNAMVEVDGEQMTAKEAGHAANEDGTLMGANNVKIGCGKSVGVDFSPSLNQLIEGDNVISDFLSGQEFMRGAADIGTVTWTFGAA